MKYQNYLNNVLKLLQDYRDSVNGVKAIYDSDKAKHDRELKDMQCKYTDEYIKEYDSKWRASNNYKDMLDKERAKKQKLANHNLDIMKNQIDKYFQAPVSADFANKIMAIKSTGMQLSKTEYELLQKQATSYMERRLLNELVASSADDADKLDMQLSAEVPNIDSIYGAYNHMRENVDNAFNFYCGDDLSLKEYIDCDCNDYINASNITHAIKCFDVDRNDSYKSFIKAMSSANDILDKGNRPNEELSDDEKSLINAILPDYDKYPIGSKLQAAEIAKTNAEMASLLLLDERYSESVSKALEESV